MTPRVQKALIAFRRVNDAQRSLERATGILNSHVEAFNQHEAKEYAIQTGAAPPDHRKQNSFGLRPGRGRDPIKKENRV